MNTIMKTDLFKNFASVITSYIVKTPSSVYYLHDNEVDLRILEQSINEKDRTLLYVVRPSGTCLLRCDRYFYPKYYLTCRGDYRNFIYVHLNLATGEHQEITWEQAEELLAQPAALPIWNGQGKFEYLKTVVDDLRGRGYGDYLEAYNLDSLRRFAIDDERPSLVKYIDNVTKIVSHEYSLH